MSWVTDALLILGLQECFDDDFEVVADIPSLAAINAWLEDHDFGTFDRLDEQVTGGGKAMQALVYGGAFNHLARNLDEFLRVVAAQPWRVPEEVQLLLKDEEEGRFGLFEIGRASCRERVSKQV